MCSASCILNFICLMVSVGSISIRNSLDVNVLTVINMPPLQHRHYQWLVHHFFPLSKIVLHANLGVLLSEARTTLWVLSVLFGRSNLPQSRMKFQRRILAHRVIPEAPGVFQCFASITQKVLTHIDSFSNLRSALRVPSPIPSFFGQRSSCM